VFQYPGQPICFGEIWSHYNVILIAELVFRPVQFVIEVASKEDDKQVAITMLGRSERIYTADHHAII